jgi:hypothetical protein
LLTISKVIAALKVIDDQLIFKALKVIYYQQVIASLKVFDGHVFSPYSVSDQDIVASLEVVGEFRNIFILFEEILIDYLQ